MVQRIGFVSVLVLFVLAPAGEANALLEGLGVVYSEDFESEVAYPTTPEVDVLSFGGMNAFQVGDPIPPAPALTGSSASSSAVAAAGSSEALQVAGVEASGAIPTSGQLGISATFENYATTTVDNHFLSAAVTLAETSSGDGPTVFLNQNLFTSFQLDVRNLGSPFGTQVALSASAIAAIQNGDPFTVELLFDYGTLAATGSLTVGGETFETAPRDSIIYDGLVFDSANASASVLNSLGGNDSISVDIADVQVFAPEPALGPAVYAALAALLLFRLRGGMARPDEQRRV